MGDDAARIETERLVLRPHEIGDQDDCAAMWRDLTVVRWIGDGQPLTAQETWARILRYAGCWRLLGYGYWAVRERTTGRFVGDVGFQSLRRHAVPALPDLPEIGWVLAASAQGRGFAREAVTAALTWADRHLPEATMCIIRPDHQRSVQVALAAGYRRVGSARLGGQDIDVFRRPKAFSTGSPVPTS